MPPPMKLIKNEDGFEGKIIQESVLRGNFFRREKNQVQKKVGSGSRGWFF